VIGYSVKTNYLPYVVKEVARFGAVPEIVSGLELSLLERLGLLGSETIVNGPLKTDDELRCIVAHGCRINVDNPTELEALERIGRETGRRIDVGFRVASEIGNIAWKRFGFRPGEVPEIARRVRVEMPHLRPVGLHIHGGTNITDCTYYRNASRLLCELSTVLTREGLLDLFYLDLGGGYATDCPFKDAMTCNIPSPQDYVEAIVGPLQETFGDTGPTLIVEPGRFLIDDAFLLLTTVERLRSASSGEVVLDAGINILPSASFRRHRVACLTQPAGAPATSHTLFGPLCMPSDCLGEAVPLPSLRPGDILAVDHAGAYSLSQAWTFIRLQPAVVVVEEAGTVVVRRAQTAEDFLNLDLFEKEGTDARMPGGNTPLPASAFGRGG
jgi:diaminopimelate decarboxylase